VAGQYAFERNPAQSPPQGYGANGVLGLNGVTLGVTNAPTAPSQVQARASILLANPGGAGPIMLQATTPLIAHANQYYLWLSDRVCAQKDQAKTIS